MKSIVVHITGLAGDPFEELDGRTLLEASKTHALDEVARRGSCGIIRLLPEGTVAGAGAELLALLGYLDEGVEPPSLGVLETLGIGAPLYARDAAFRVNLGSLGEDGTITDTSGGAAPVEDLLSLMQLVDEKLSTRRLSFYPGRGFAHVMVWTDGPADVRCVPAPLARGKPIEEVLPEGEGDGPLRQLIYDSAELLDRHRINHRRREDGQPPVNLLWPWAPGRPPEFEHFALKIGLQAAVLASRLEVLGAAKAVGIPAKEAPFDFSASAPALVRVAQENSLACLHVDLPERFERSTAPEAYLPTFEAFDTDLLSPVLDEVRTSADAVRLILLGTWRESGWVQRPPALWGAWPPLRAAMAIDSFTEPALRELGDGIAEPERLLIEGNSGT